MYGAVAYSEAPYAADSEPLIGLFVEGYSLPRSLSNAVVNAIYSSKSYAFGISSGQAQSVLVVGLVGNSQSRGLDYCAAQLDKLLFGETRSKSAGFAQITASYKVGGNVSGKHRSYASLFELLPVLIRRDFAVYMRFTGYNYGSTEAYREATWHEPLIVDLPQPEESLRDEFGIQSGDTLEVTVADTTLRATLEGGTLDGASVLIEWVTTSHYVSGPPVDAVFKRTYTVKGYTYRAGLVALRLVNIEDVRLSAVYPDKIFKAADWPEIFPEHVGRAVPFAVGTAVKVPCTLVETTAGAGPWKFAICNPVTVLTVYRNGRVVGASEYTIGAASAGGYFVTTLTFTSEQVDFNGNLHVIEADVVGSSSNAVTELQRVLTAAGVTVDATTFAAGTTYANTNIMQVDLAYTEQREYGAIIFDLLHACRASLKRNSVGAYELVQDTEQSVTWTYDETAGDLVQVTEYSSADAPQNSTLAYRPNIADTNKLQHLISRNAGGVAGTEHLDAPYIRDHTAADRLNDYLAKRRQYGATARADVYIDNVELGQVLAVASTSFWSGSKSWKVQGIRRKPGCNEVDLLQYNTNVYNYTPQTFPADATTGYSPDYSATPPTTPTAVAIVSQGVALNTDGVALSYALVKATPPTLNWKEVWFQATNTTTNEIYQGVGSSNGDGTYGVKLAGLRPNTAHTLVSWAVNAFNVKGVVSTAINFTSTAWSSAPGHASALIATQGTGKQIQLRWTAASGTNIREYNVNRSVNGGGYSNVAKISGTNYSDNNVAYGSSYSYRVVTVDRAGNLGADVEVTSLTLQVNVGTPDLTPGGVTTPIRQTASGFATAAVGMFAGELRSFTYTHNLGKIPTSPCYSSNNNVAVWYSNLTTTQATVCLYCIAGTGQFATFGFEYW